MTPRQPLPAPFSRQPFSHADGLAGGIGKGRLAGGDLQRPFHGVRHPAPGDLTLEQLCASFQEWMPASAFFHSVTAAMITGLPLPLWLEKARPLHVAVPLTARAPAGRGIRGHTVELMGGDSLLWHGLRVSSPERTWCDLAVVLTLDDLVAAGDYIIHLRMPLRSLAQLADAVSRYPGRRGIRRLNAALEMLDGRSASPQESRMRVILMTAAIAGFACNREIWVDGKQFFIDFAFEDCLLALEYQGDYHRDPEQWRKDMTRDTALASIRWLTLYFNADDLRDPATLAALIKRVLAERRAARNA